MGHGNYVSNMTPQERLEHDKVMLAFWEKLPESTVSKRNITYHRNRIARQEKELGI